MKQRVKMIAGGSWAIFSLLTLMDAATDPVAGLVRESWSYDGAKGSLRPPQWHVAYPACGGPSQSPVRLYRDKAVSRQYPPFTGYLSDSSFTLRNVRLLNNGYTAELVLPEGKYTLEGGGLGASYYAAGLHFHWGPSDSLGAEHEVGSRRYPLEVHIVHYKKIYGSILEAMAALNDSTAIAVLGLLIQVGNKENDYFAPIVKGIHALGGRMPSVDVTLPSLALVSLVQHAYNSGFYRYHGSLTTPGCNEQVVWTVFDQPLTISPQQAGPFRNLISKLGTVMLTNTRPIQPTGSRTISHSA